MSEFSESLTALGDLESSLVKNEIKDGLLVALQIRDLIRIICREEIRLREEAKGEEVVLEKDRPHWFCSHCKTAVPPEAVTFSEYHDPRAGGCGMRVEWHGPGKAADPDPNDRRIAELEGKLYVSNEMLNALNAQAVDKEIPDIPPGGLIASYVLPELVKRRERIAELESHLAKVLVLCNSRLDWVKQLEQERDRLKGELSRWIEAMGLLSTLHPHMIVDAQEPVLMAKSIEKHVLAELADMEKRKDDAYTEREQVVAGFAHLARLLGYKAGLKRTNIPGWSDDWHNCAWIDLPTGQVSWHMHDSHLPFFKDMPAYDGEWDGHDTPEKYRRVLALSELSRRDAPAGLTEEDFITMHNVFSWLLLERDMARERGKRVFEVSTEDRALDRIEQLREALRARATAPVYPLKATDEMVEAAHSALHGTNAENVPIMRWEREFINAALGKAPRQPEPATTEWSDETLGEIIREVYISGRTEKQLRNGLRAILQRHAAPAVADEDARLCADFVLENSDSQYKQQAARRVLGRPTAKPATVQERNHKVKALIREWMNDPSDYDEKTWPAIEAALAGKPAAQAEPLLKYQCPCGGYVLETEKTCPNCGISRTAIPYTKAAPPPPDAVFRPALERLVKIFDDLEWLDSDAPDLSNAILSARAVLANPPAPASDLDAVLAAAKERWPKKDPWARKSLFSDGSGGYAVWDSCPGDAPNFEENTAAELIAKIRGGKA